MRISKRRTGLFFAVGGPVALLIVTALTLPGGSAGAPEPSLDRASRVKAESQPSADQGNGFYLNPILPGEYPDPTVVRVGRDYYMTHTPGPAWPGLLVWHSRDLVNWEPLGPALTRAVGDVWAPDIGYRDGTFFIYFPALIAGADGKPRRTNFVVTARDPSGPWSDPVDLNVGGIDPGHVVDDAGNRCLYLSGGMMVRLSADGRRAMGAPAKVYDGWGIPAEWNIECKCLESPKLFRRGRFYYLVSAQGGTAGPSTSHMIVVARAESPAGPWTNMPGNPLLRTERRSLRWWSQGHGTILEAADGSWWALYHGYDNGFRTLGRSTLLLPVEWTADDWPRIPASADSARSLRKPAGENVGHGLPLSDDFSAAQLGLQWRKWDADGSPSDFVSGDGELRMRARGASVAEASLLTVSPVDHSYEASVQVDAPPTAEAGLLLHYDGANYAGIGVRTGEAFVLLKDGVLDRIRRGEGPLFLKIRNVEHDVELFISPDGRDWTKFEGGLEMSGYHHDVFRTWGTLKIALFASGRGTVVFRDFRYRGMRGRAKATN